MQTLNCDHDPTRGQRAWYSRDRDTTIAVVAVVAPRDSWIDAIILTLPNPSFIVGIEAERMRTELGFLCFDSFLFKPLDRVLRLAAMQWSLSEPSRDQFGNQASNFFRRSS